MTRVATPENYNKTWEQDRSSYYNGSPSVLYKLNAMVNIHLVIEDQMVCLQLSYVLSATRCLQNLQLF